MRATRVAVMLVVMLCAAGVAMAQTEWVQHPDNPIIGPGEPGAWDARGHQIYSVVFDGSVYHMSFAGYSEAGYLTDFGHATSADGVEWTMDPANPVLMRGEPGEWDSRVFWSAAVFHDGSQFHMWYGAEDGEGYARAGYATSPDGSQWTKHPQNPVIEAGTPYEWNWFVVPWTVIVEGGTYRMWYYSCCEPSNGIGYAESLDGIHWVLRPDSVLATSGYPGASDNTAVCCPSVQSTDTGFHMWYSGFQADNQGYDYAHSIDGIAWTKHRDNPVMRSDTEELWDPIVLFDGGSWRMWYQHWDGSTSWLSYATSDCCPVVGGMSNSRVIPAAAVASGAEGAFYQTDVDLNNAGSQPVEYQLMWLPRGEDNTEPMTSETFTLGAGMSVRYANVLREVFDLEPELARSAHAGVVER